MKNIIKTENLVYSYQAPEGEYPLRVLNGIDVEIESGTFMAILGHNGSGKSTFAKHLNGILLPEGGAVYVDGISTADEQCIIDIRRRVGMVFQNPDNQIVSNVVAE